MKVLRALLILLAGAMILAPPESVSCGPFLPVAQFSYTLGPTDTRAFDLGALGIVRSHYYRRNLIVAYRYFTGAPLTKEEAAALSPKAPMVMQAEGKGAPRFSFDTPASAQVWLVARNAVPGVQPLTMLTVDRKAPGGDGFQEYTNCLADAFSSAAATLKERGVKWSANRAALAEWVRGQDQVFQNCSEGSTVPAALPSGTDALLAADRQYQIAAAEFYAEKFDDAEHDFQAVGGNAASPWRGAAPYLVARTLIRKATLRSDDSALQAAQRQLQAILDDPARQAWHARTRSLLNLVRARIDPEARMVELGTEIVKPGPGSRLAQDITDYTALWDKLEHGPAAQSELADWIATFQGAGDAKHATDRWRQTKSAAWLVAALERTTANDAAVPELIAAARQLKPQDPVYATATYLALKLKIGGRSDGETRQWVDQALAARVPDDARNDFLAQRLTQARNWSEFLQYAPRKPVAVNTYVVDEQLNDRQVAAGLQLTGDSVGPLNGDVPLARWVDAARNSLLPRNIQVQVAEAGWVRAIVLDRPAEARKLATRLLELKPELAEGLHAYLAETDAAAAKFAAVFLVLRDPGFDLKLRAGFPRETKIDALDEFRDNWWKLDEPVADDAPKLAEGFLPAEEVVAGRKEAQELLATAGVAPNYLSAQTLDWARQHPADSRVPEALHLAVRTTRFGHTDELTTTYSKAAFQLLHGKYPNSKWAAQTKYWY